MDAPQLIDELLVAFVTYDRRPSKAAAKRCDQAIAAVLRVMLQREPTQDEIRAACQ